MTVLRPRLARWSLSLGALSLLLLTSCPPGRDPGGGDPPAISTVGVWVVLSQVGSPDDASHTFVEVNKSNYCSAYQSAITAYYEAYGEMLDAQRTIREKFEEKLGYDYYDDAEYRRQICEAQVDMYEAVADVDTIWVSGRVMTTIQLWGADGSVPEEGTYPTQDEYYDYGDDDSAARGGYGSPYFYGWVDRIHGDLYQAFADSYDCNDPEGYDGGYDYDEDLSESHQISEGTIEASFDSGTSWRLVLEDGALENGDPVTLDRSFERCDITYEPIDYGYAYEG